MYHSTGKPTPAKFRARLARMSECADTGLELAERWNPKGRNYELRRALIRFFRDSGEIIDVLLEELNRRN